MKYICNKCGLSKINKDGIKKTCKKCAAERQRQYWIENPEQYLKQKARVKVNDQAYKRIFLRHGLTEEVYQTMMAKYEGTCWACRIRKATCVDHDHTCCNSAFSCGKCVRGVLCSQCNTALGLLQDNPIYIEKLMAYSLMAKQ